MLYLFAKSRVYKLFHKTKQKNESRKKETIKHAKSIRSTVSFEFSVEKKTKVKNETNRNNFFSSFMFPNANWNSMEIERNTTNDRNNSTEIQLRENHQMFASILFSIQSCIFVVLSFNSIPSDHSNFVVHTSGNSFMLFIT